MRDNGVYVRSTATTAAGHVLVSGTIRYEANPKEHSVHIVLTLTPLTP